MSVKQLAVIFFDNIFHVQELGEVGWDLDVYVGPSWLSILALF